MTFWATKYSNSFNNGASRAVGIEVFFFKMEVNGKSIV